MPESPPSLPALPLPHALVRHYEELVDHLRRRFRSPGLARSVAASRLRPSRWISKGAITQYISYYSQTTRSNPSCFSGRGRVLTLGWQYRY